MTSYPQKTCCPLCVHVTLCPKRCGIAPNDDYGCPENCNEPCWNEGRWLFKKKQGVVEGEKE